jgi:dephospho-CoA kinase
LNALYSGKPIIGIVGGIGSGKSFVAKLFGSMGCFVVQSDKLAEEAYNQGEIRRQLSEQWGAKVFESDGKVDRKALAGIVFNDAEARRRLETIVHPFVNRRRDELMAERVGDAAAGEVAAFVWDTPLLMETGLDRQCDTVVFVEAPQALREARLAAGRGWDGEELNRREILQLPLDKKRKISEYVVENTADADYARGQVQEVLSRIRGLSA